MNRLPRKSVFSIFTLLVLIALWLLTPWYMALQLKSFLRSQGFAFVSIGATHVGFSGVEFSAIKLDKDGNSTVDFIQAPLSFGTPHALALSGLTLSGDTGANGLPVIDGWHPQALAFPDTLQSLVIDNSKLDLTTPAGGLTIQLRAQMTAPDKKARHFDAVLTGNQNQWTFDTRWAGNWYSNGKWEAKGEINDMRMRTTYFNASRIAGWLDLRSPTDEEAHKDGMLVLGGKITAGLVSLGPAFLHDASMTFSGPPRSFDAVLQGLPQGKPTMRLNAEISQDNGISNVNASIRAASLNDLFDFLQNTRDGLDTDSLLVDKPLSGLLLTQGNLDRITEKLKDTGYKAVMLSLTGPADTVSGVVTAESPTPSGGIDRHAVNFDPAATAP